MNIKKIYFALCIVGVNVLASEYETEKVALVWGMGQDGKYLSKLLLDKEYKVYGIGKSADQKDFRQNVYDFLGIEEDSRCFKLFQGDISDSNCVFNKLSKIRPTQIYNLAAQSSIPESFKNPDQTYQTNFEGTLNILETMQSLDLWHIKFVQAASIEIFTGTKADCYDENSLLSACSPYGTSKLLAYKMLQRYRKRYGTNAGNAILCNHESPERPEGFITQKVAKAVAEIFLGKRDNFSVGNIHAQRDWGHARDYVKAMKKMADQAKMDDYIIATGKVHSVKDLIESAFSHTGRTIVWSGEGIDEKGCDSKTGHVLVTINPEFYRPNEAQVTTGNTKKIYEKLYWQPETTFDELVKEMVETQIKKLQTK
ncbi:MAG: GDP-mannose 4,6-dehydratase [Candidatus Dependentiae bacterium]